MGKIIAICKSDEKGTAKYEVETVQVRVDHGIEGDAHAGNWHRQISMLAVEKINAFNEKGAKVDFGAFGENLVVEGLDLKALPIGTQFSCGEVVLALTQIGKECHTRCQIYHRMGDCIMPKEGVFCKVVTGGTLKVGMELNVKEV